MGLSLNIGKDTVLPILLCKKFMWLSVFFFLIIWRITLFTSSYRYGLCCLYWGSPCNRVCCPASRKRCDLKAIVWCWPCKGSDLFLVAWARFIYLVIYLIWNFPWNLYQIKKGLRGVKVEVTHRGNVRRKYRVSGLTSQPTRELVWALYVFAHNFLLDSELPNLYCSPCKEKKGLYYSMKLTRSFYLRLMGVVAKILFHPSAYLIASYCIGSRLS